MKNIRTRDFWNCLCETDYIHRRYESFCRRCSTHEKKQPSSKVDEVLEYLKAEYEAMIYQIEVADCYGLYEIGVLLRNSEDTKEINRLLNYSPKANNNIAQRESLG